MITSPLFGNINDVHRNLTKASERFYNASSLRKEGFDDGSSYNQAIGAAYGYMDAAVSDSEFKDYLKKSDEFILQDINHKAGEFSPDQQYSMDLIFNRNLPPRGDNIPVNGWDKAQSVNIEDFRKETKRNFVGVLIYMVQSWRSSPEGRPDSEKTELINLLKTGFGKALGLKPEDFDKQD